MTSNSKHQLFIGSYAPENEPSIHGCIFNSDTGDLTVKSSFKGIESPSFLIPHPNGRWLYAVSETGEGSHGRVGSVWAFEIQPNLLELTPLNQQSSQGDWPCHVEIDQTGRWLITSNYGTGNAALYPIREDGSLGKVASFVQHVGNGPNQDRQAGAHAHSAVFTPDNQFVIVADLGIDQLVIYAFSSESGSLKKHAEIATNPGSGPRHFAFHPNNQILYCANELNSSVTVYAYDAAAGLLESVQTLSTIPADNPENTVADIHISSSGSQLYVSNRGDNNVAVYNIDGGGRLSAAGFPSCGGNWPRNFAPEPNGRFLLIANRRTNDISILSIESEEPLLSGPVNQISLSEPSCIKFV